MFRFFSIAILINWLALVATIGVVGLGFEGQSYGLIAAIMLDLLNGASLVETCERTFSATSFVPDIKEFSSLFQFPDEVVVRNHFSSACYVDLAVPATLYLALKYHDDPERALIANTMCGGDNCGRGALLGAILGAAQPQKWPQRWLDGLLNPPRIVELG